MEDGDCKCVLISMKHVYVYVYVSMYVCMYVFQRAKRAHSLVMSIEIFGCTYIHMSSAR